MNDALLVPMALFLGLSISRAEPNTNFTALAQHAASAIATSPALPAMDVIETLAGRLRKQFDTWLEHPDLYAKKALAECRIFPEGAVYPFAIPAMAYANIAHKNKSQLPHAERQMRKLIDLLIPIVIEKVKPPGGDLLKLKTYKKQGTYLSTLNMALACYERMSEDRRYRVLHAHVSKLLCESLEILNGRPLASYPELTWYFDTIMALNSIAIEDETHGLSRAEALMNRHREWLQLNATDKLTGLPIAYENELPRGCDLSMQVCLLADWMPAQAGILYSNYVRSHWVDLGLVSGFREWPKSEPTQPFEVEIDSGPVFMGIGMTATGMGVGAAIAARDDTRLDKLARELQALPDLLKLLLFAEGQTGSLFAGRVPFDASMATGFLYGDAMMFYATTWARHEYKKASN
jgi:hypothetical protein